MATFSCEIAQIVLFLYCITRTLIECGKDNGINLTRRSEPVRYKWNPNQDFIFTIVTDVDDPSSRCGAVWISGSCLLTAASCLDKKGVIDLSKTGNSLINIKVKQMEYMGAGTSAETFNLDDFLSPNTKETTGAAIAHPLYRRVEGMTIAYDLAVVRVNFNKEFKKFHGIGTLCTKDKPNPKLIALGLLTLKKQCKIVCQWSLEKKAEKDIAIVYNEEFEQGEEYFIDHRKQFTTYINRPNYRGSIFTTEGYGGPILDENNGRCILGIMNFAAKKKDTFYITSTKVTPVINWIKYTMNYLRKNTGQSKLTKLHGIAGMKYWNLRGVNPDPIGSDNSPGITPGEPVDKKAKESQGKPGKPLRQTNPAQ